jgi:hypothetical protein
VVDGRPLPSRRAVVDRWSLGAFPSWPIPYSLGRSGGSRRTTPPANRRGRRRSPRAWCEGDIDADEVQAQPDSSTGGVTPPTSSASSSLPRAGARALSIYAGVGVALDASPPFHGRRHQPWASTPMSAVDSASCARLHKVVISGLGSSGMTVRPGPFFVWGRARRPGSLWVVTAVLLPGDYPCYCRATGSRATVRGGVRGYALDSCEVTRVQPRSC